MPIVLDGTTGITMPAGGLANTAGAAVGTTDSQTLTNKTIQGGALTLATTVTASGTAVDFTGIPSWVKRITVVFNGISLVGNADFIIRLGSGSLVTSGYTSNGYRITPTAAGSTSTAGLLVMTYAASALARGHYTLILQNPSTNTWVGSGQFVGTDIVSMFTGTITLSGAVDRLRVTTSGGTDTFDAGTINIMYEG